MLVKDAVTNNITCTTGNSGSVYFSLSSSHNVTEAYLGVLSPTNVQVLRLTGSIANNKATFNITSTQTQQLFTQFSVLNATVVLTYGVTFINSYGNIDTVIPALGSTTSFTIKPVSPTEEVFNTSNITVESIYALNSRNNLNEVYANKVFTVNSLSDITKIAAAVNDSCIVVSTKTVYSLLALPSTMLSNWVPVANYVNPQNNVTSINGLTQDVTLTSTNVGAIATTSRGAINGVASLDNTGVVPIGQLPLNDITNYVISIINTNSSSSSSNSEESSSSSEESSSSS